MHDIAFIRANPQEFDAALEAAAEDRTAADGRPAHPQLVQELSVLKRVLYRTKASV